MIPSHRSPAHFWQRIQSTGPAGFAPALLRRMALKMDQRYDFLRAELPVRIEDLVDSSGMRPPHPSRTPDASLRIGWVCSPPGPGSGGHTTLFRMVEEAEQRGHECTLLLYDRNSDDVARHEPVIRRYWPDIRAGIRSATGAIGGMHALVASSWGTAHVVARRAPSTVNCFYFIQDYEPYFYPRGALYALAEDTYRFGFTNIALGEMVASRLQSELGITADATVPFGCDTSTYKLLRRAFGTPRRHCLLRQAKRGPSWISAGEACIRDISSSAPRPGNSHLRRHRVGLEHPRHESWILEAVRAQRFVQPDDCQRCPLLHQYFSGCRRTDGRRQRACDERSSIPQSRSIHDGSHLGAGHSCWNRTWTFGSCFRGGHRRQGPAPGRIRPADMAPTVSSCFSGN